MSDAPASPPRLQTFLVFAPDGKGEGALDLRYSVRSQHLEGVNALIASKVIRFGGIILDTNSQPTEADPRLRIAGSTMVFEAESIEKVRELITSDIYYKSGVWDPERLVIVPFIVTPIP
ncbi:hypothetical protein D9611_000085 [Ephemerocybe angulata]|uniref:YCII-related domain-containing protein n=1 Tax=Ephemerocybe angulata TaxID=980116 RepID=A0A8H5BNQ7_9AGAR|nr:hypothetical protein D9611_000085 [Tulosesus angulatus]